MSLKTNIGHLAKEIGETVILQSDARILRECIAGIMKRAPATVAAHCDGALKRYALSVSRYCEHEDCAVFDEKDKTGRLHTIKACLDCGVRLDP